MKTRFVNVVFSAALVPQYAGTAFAADTWSVGAAATPIGQLIVNVGGFLSDIILPLLFTLAVLFFLFNMAKYFIIGGASDGERDKAKRNAIYSVAAFVFMFILWALINVGLTALGDATGNRNGLLNSANQSACPDYYSLFGKSCN